MQSKATESMQMLQKINYFGQIEILENVEQENEKEKQRRRGCYDIMIEEER